MLNAHPARPTPAQSMRVASIGEDGLDEVTLARRAREVVEIPMGRDPVEILERFVPIAEALDAPKATRPRRLRCPTHPDAGVMTVCDATGCSVVFSRRPAEPEPVAEALCVEVPRIEPEPPTVAGSVVTPVRHARIEPDGLDELTLVRRAREAVESGGRQADPSKQAGHPMRESHERVSLGPLKVAPKPWRCPECPAQERKILPDGSSRCARGHVTHQNVAGAGVAG